MRLWHKDLIPVLPRQQLLGQWRECCAIAKKIAEDGTPNHILVNRITNYSPSHFYAYGRLVASQMTKRGYKVDIFKFVKWFSAYSTYTVSHDEMFVGWHDDRYFMQCFYNLEEKYDCGGIPYDEWGKIVECFLKRKFKS